MQNYIRNDEIEKYILYEDGDVLVCHKPSGLAVQSARVSARDMESLLKNYLAARTPGKMPYLGIIHRLDQPVEGIVVFAKNQKAAAELSRQMTAGRMEKIYLAVTEGKPGAREGILEDYLKKDGRTNTSAVTSSSTPGAKKARLSYQLLEEVKVGEHLRYLLQIRLETGRHHQIRVQMAHAEMPLCGDGKYNPGGAGSGGNARCSTVPGEGIHCGSAHAALGLCACRLTFVHPSTGKKMKFEVSPQGEAFKAFTKKPE